jgi:hypothetical protein
VDLLDELEGVLALGAQPVDPVAVGPTGWWSRRWLSNCDAVLTKVSQISAPGNGLKMVIKTLLILQY